MSQPGPTPYSQTLLLDCNRRQSVEFSASNLADTNTALFTNQVSSGITLDIGDQVSIQSAHIAQRGAGGDIIEFAGKTLGQYNISYTKTTSSSFVGFDIIDIGSSVGFPNPDVPIQKTPEGYAFEESENITEEIQEKDNEASIVISYYKNTNGENYISLPRNFGQASGVYGGSYSSTLKAAEQWAVPDGYPVGCQTYPLQASHVYADDWQVTDGRSASDALVEFRKIRNDNSRFTIFKQSRVVWDVNAVSIATSKEYLENGSFLAAGAPSEVKSDPALHPYILYKEKKTIQIPQGYNSPANVAADITNQLTTTDEPSFINSSFSTGGRFTDENTVIVNSTLNKAFPCTNYNLFSASFARPYFNSNASFVGAPGPPTVDYSGGNGGDVSRATQYLNSYAYVGFKRPEIVEAGRNSFPYNGFVTNSQLALASASSAVIETNLAWTDANLQKFKSLFEAQALYPDLIRGGLDEGRSNYSDTVNPTSASLGASFAQEARFLHLDLKKQDAAFANYPVGDDMYNVSVASSSIDAPPLATEPDLSSVPVFVAYNPDTINLNGSDAVASSYENLAFGFGKRIRVPGGTDLIALTTEKIGGIPDSYYKELGIDLIRSNTKLGYDYHFNAYGNAAIMLSSGYAPIQYYGQQAFTAADFIRSVYVGSNNPAFLFNQQASRFEIENLHTAEKVGNFYNAGDPNPTSNVFGPPPSGQGGEDCYKINKQLHYTTWSPSMFPYSVISVSLNAANPDNVKSFPQVNINLELDTIYDSQCGITIEDMGFSHKNFDQGLWGILGYEYNQFYPEGPNIKNRLMEYQDTTTNVNGITTNADISSVDSQTYSVNVYSINLYTQQLNSQVNYFNASKTFGDYTGTPDFTVSPTSVVLANSTRITSAKLPRRILRGYFLINSDILDQANYYNTSNPMATMADVGKYQGSNGFIEYGGGGAVFTVTRKKTITSIKTQILDPEGGLGQVGDNSGVIYRIDKNIKTDLNFAENTLAGVYK